MPPPPSGEVTAPTGVPHGLEGFAKLSVREPSVRILTYNIDTVVTPPWASFPLKAEKLGQLVAKHSVDLVVLQEISREFIACKVPGTPPRPHTLMAHLPPGWAFTMVLSGRSKDLDDHHAFAWDPKVLTLRRAATHQGPAGQFTRPPVIADFAVLWTGRGPRPQGALTELLLTSVHLKSSGATKLTQKEKDDGSKVQKKDSIETREEVRILGGSFYEILEREFGAQRMTSLIICGDFNLAPDAASKPSPVDPDGDNAWKPLEARGFKPVNAATTNVAHLVSDATGPKVYDNFVVHSTMVSRLMNVGPAALKSCVIQTDYEEYQKWATLKLPQKVPYSLRPQWDRFKADLREAYETAYPAKAPQVSKGGKPSNDFGKYFRHACGGSDHRPLFIDLGIAAVKLEPGKEVGRDSRGQGEGNVPVFVDDTLKVQHNLMCQGKYASGVKEGRQCDARSKPGSSYCGRHKAQNPQSQPAARP